MLALNDWHLQYHHFCYYGMCAEGLRFPIQYNKGKLLETAIFVQENGACMHRCVGKPEQMCRTAQSTPKALRHI